MQQTHNDYGDMNILRAVTTFSVYHPCTFLPAECVMPNSAATQDSLRILSQYNISKWLNKPESAVADMPNIPDRASALCLGVCEGD